MQAFISDYTLDSLASSFLSTNQYNFWIHNSDVPSTVIYKLDTTWQNIFFPGLSKKYGLGVPMDIELNIVTLKNFTSIQDSETMSFNADLNLKFYVNQPNCTNELAVEILLKDFYFDFNAVVNDMLVHP